jgi:hypothetical protein
MPKHDHDGLPTAARRDAGRPAIPSSRVDEASEESFPASDPPSYTIARLGTPRRPPDAKADDTER